MSLFVDRSSGVDQPTVTTDLFTVSWNDGNLGQGADTTVDGDIGGITTIPVAPVTYTPSVTTGMASADRLFALVNNDAADGLNWGNPIVITPIAGGNDPYIGDSVVGNAWVYVDTGATPPVIHVVYDTSQALGQGIALFDVNGDLIQTPNAVILYHELSHAFHRAINQSPFPQSDCPGVTTDEPAATIDENVLRSQLGLCLRDVCNHGGAIGWGKACGGRATPDGPVIADGTANDGGRGCFIVTAATGSDQAYEIRRLRAMRDRLAARSQIVKRLLAAVYGEYFQFSPGVAAEIASDAASRAAVRDFVIAPLFAWYELAEALATGRGDQHAAERRARAVAEACRPALATIVLPLIDRVLEGRPAPATTPERLLGVGEQVREAARLPLARWALLAPLRQAWACAGDSCALAAAVADWLAAAPVERLDPPPPASLDVELREVAGFFDFAPAARLRLGVRLAEAWPAAWPVLHRHGFVEGATHER